MKPLQVGQKIATWFSGKEDGMSTILEISPYRGKYKDMFTHVIRATAHNTRRGWMEFAHHHSDPL